MLNRQNTFYPTSTQKICAKVSIFHIGITFFKTTAPNFFHLHLKL